MNEINDSNNQFLNPWFSMWTKPRATIQQIVDSNSDRFILLLAAISGVSHMLSRAMGKNWGDKMELYYIIVFVAIIAPLAGILYLYLSSVIIQWTGKWLGGLASLENIRAAIAWSNVPIILSLVVWLFWIVLSGQKLFTAQIPEMNANPLMFFIYTGFTVMNVIIVVWSIVIMLKSLGQVQGFSTWKALGNVLISVMFLVIPVVLLLFIMVW